MASAEHLLSADEAVHLHQPKDGFEMTKEQTIKTLCANEFAMMKGRDRPEFVLIDSDPVSNPLRDWLQANPLYPTVFTYDNGIEQYCTIERDNPECEQLFRKMVETSQKSGVAFSLAANDGKPHSTTTLYPEGMTREEAARRSKLLRR